DGRIEGLFDARSDETGGTVLEGGGRASDLLLHSESVKADFAVETIPFLLASAPSSANKKSRGRREAITGDPNATRLLLGPFSLKLARAGSTTIQGWVARGGYSISVKGDADVRRILQVSRVAGIPVIHPTATGSAKLDLQVTGEWPGFAPPTITGTAELHSV